MASPSRDSAQEKPVEPLPRTFPLRVVKFISPVQVPNFGTLGVTYLEAGATRLIDGRDTLTPQPLLNLITRSVQVNGREFPLERVEYWERAPAAINLETKTPTPSPEYTIGRRSSKS